MGKQVMAQTDSQRPDVDKTFDIVEPKNRSIVGAAKKARALRIRKARPLIFGIFTPKSK